MNKRIYNIIGFALGASSYFMSNDFEMNAIKKTSLKALFPRIRYQHHTQTQYPGTCYGVSYTSPL